MRMAQIGIAPCGCVVAAHVEWCDELNKRLGGRLSAKDYNRNVRKSVMEWMKAGLSIGRIDMDSVENIFTECADPNCAHRLSQNEAESTATLFESTAS